MKKLFLFLTLSLFAGFANAQIKSAPKNTVIIKDKGVQQNTKSTATAPPNDTVAMPGPAKDIRLTSFFQPFVDKSAIKFNFTSSKAPNADGTAWYSTFGEGTLDWNSNKTVLVGNFVLYFSNRKQNDQAFANTKGENVTIEINATNQDVTITRRNFRKTFITSVKNGLVYGFNNGNEIIVLTIPTKDIR